VAKRGVGDSKRLLIFDLKAVVGLKWEICYYSERQKGKKQSWYQVLQLRGWLKLPDGLKVKMKESYPCSG